MFVRIFNNPEFLVNILKKNKDNNNENENNEEKELNDDENQSKMFIEFNGKHNIFPNHKNLDNNTLNAYELINNNESRLVTFHALCDPTNIDGNRNAYLFDDKFDQV